MGCTEPAAIALATALATAAARGEVPAWLSGGPVAAPGERPADFVLELLEVRTVRSLYKNAMAVGIPNTDGGSGIYLAAALGPYLEGGARLNLLKGAGPAALAAAHALLGGGLLGLEVREHPETVYAEARVILVAAGERHVGEAVIQGSHDGVTLLRRDGRVRHRADPPSAESRSEGVIGALVRATLADLIDVTGRLDDATAEHLLRGVAINREAARIGLAQRLGMGVGASLQALVDGGELSVDPATRASVLTAAATDARMSGHDVEVMSSSGSGNQGIIAVLPAAVLAEHLGASDADLARAVALAHLVTAVMTEHTGVLSALCGCVVKAGMGSAAAVALLLGLPEAGILATLKNMAGNMTGEICDGAKVGCAVKLCTAARAAVLSALLARSGTSIPVNNGILASRAPELFAHIGELAQSMREVDLTIVRIMERKRLQEAMT
jgi:L-cysteine desulfidase